MTGKSLLERDFARQMALAEQIMRDDRDILRVISNYDCIDSTICYHSLMNSANKKTLEAIFSSPVPTTMEWRRIELLFMALGAQTIEGNGSRVRFILNEQIGTFHRPHPQKEAKPYQVRDARLFLEQAGIKPEKE